ncbi:DNA/RNA non-specific endonuclease [Caulobacter hibisci]|nr:DNA/RNA non-specific endonuclease [Caulobacter hibisci]
MSALNAVDSAAGRAASSTAGGASQAAGLVAASRTGGQLNTSELAGQLSEIAKSDPAKAQNLRAEIEAGLSPADQKRLADDVDAAAAAQRQELILDLGQMALDVVGLVDPTPISDGANGVISLFRGDFLGAGLSAVSMVPYIGDAAKLGKLGKWAETVSKAADLAKIDSAFAAAAKPALEKLKGAIDALPLDKLPDSARQTLETASRKLDEALSARPRVELEQGAKGGWNAQLNGPLAANTDYVVSGRYTYHTDAKGRVEQVVGTLDLKHADRNGYQQSKAGQENGVKDGVAGDEGGHLIAAIFNGPGEQINYHAMDGALNKSGWKVMENEWAAALKDGKAVDVDIKAVFDGDSKRPEAFRVEYVIDGKPSTRTFFND